MGRGGWARMGATVFGVAVLSACPGATPRSARSPSPRSTSPRSTSARPVVSPSLGAGSPSSPACPAPPAYPSPDPDRPAYTISVRAEPADRTARGKLAVTFTADLPTNHLVFRLWPNGPIQAGEGAHLSAGPVSETNQGRLATEQPDPTTLIVHLGRTLAPGQPVTVSMPWTLTVPGPILDRIGASENEMRLGSFFPILAWVPGTGWATDPPTTTLAEASTSPTANFDVSITAPDGYQILATGSRVDATRWHAFTVRDFAIAVGHFQTSSSLLYMPNPVRITVGVEDGVGTPPDAIVGALTHILPELANVYGRYPWPNLTIAVTRDVGRSGIEYPNFVFEGADGIQRVTTHELAHQWFYSLVGNDQAAEPWLDEALATWAAARHDGYMDYLLHLSMKGVPPDHVGAGMAYWDHHEDVYQTGVYVRGLQALASLGSQSRVDCALRYYAARHAYGIATTRDLVEALQMVFPDAADKLARFGIRVSLQPSS